MAVVGIAEFFKEEKIEYYCVLSYADCIETAPSIMGRESFTPRSVILFLLPYYSGETDNLSRYASSKDYHIAIRKTGEGLISCLEATYPGYSFKTYGDHSPINELHAALIGGLGIKGDSGLLINERYGTFVFIGDVITDIPPDMIGASSPKSILSCEHCGRCLKACPTGILRQEGCDCLSAITQRKGELTNEEVELMRKFNTVWGCDECQIACPHNNNPVITPIDFFKEDRICKLTTELVEGMSKKEFEDRAFAWRGLRTVLRNLKLLDE